MQEADAHHVAVEVACPVEHISLNRRVGVVFKGRARADVGDAAPPCAVKQRRRDIDAARGDDAILRMQIRGWKTYRPPALVPAHNAPLDAVRPPQHAAREIDAPLREQFAYPA